MGDFLLAEIEKIKENPSYIAKTNIDYNELINIDLGEFPHNYVFYSEESANTWIHIDQLPELEFFFFFLKNFFFLFLNFFFIKKFADLQRKNDRKMEKLL